MQVTYFIQQGEFVKIGESSLLHTRMATLQIGSPYKLKLLKTSEQIAEREAHKIAAGLTERVRGEWFAMNEALANWIASLPDGDETKDPPKPVGRPRKSISTVRMTFYVLPETANRVIAAAGRRPLGHAVDDAFADRFVNVAKPYAGPPRVLKAQRAAVQTAIATIPHPIACQCDACTLARLNSPQTRKK